MSNLSVSNPAVSNSSIPSASALVVFHGSHDVQYQASVQQFLIELQQAWRSHATRSDHSTDFSIQGAFLDCVPQPLHQQIQAAVRDRRSMLIMPLFLLPGVHVMEDIPAEVAIAEAQLPQVNLQVLPYLGSLPNLAMALGQTFGPATGRIVMAHGSRRLGGNQPAETLATGLNAMPAFWSVEPSLETQVEHWYDRGIRQVEILPYFLFEGALTASIRDRMTAMIQKWPDLEIKLLPTLSQQPGLIELITNLFTKHSGLSNINSSLSNINSSLSNINNG